MKNVQMRINPELYAKFKLVDGESNNERMSKLLGDSKNRCRLIKENNKLKNERDLHKKMSNHWLDESCLKDGKVKTLASALVVSIAVSVACVGYVCVVNGWFL
jgi:hypothetical protein